MLVNPSAILIGTSPTFPARPYACLNALTLESFAGWMFEPKANGWRCKISLAAGEVVSRHGTTFSEAGRVLDLAHSIKELAGFDQLDCEFLGKRTKAGRGSLVIIDIMDCSLPYLERMALLSGFAECPLDDIPTDSVMRFPRYTQAKAQVVLEDMREINMRRHEVVWEGFVAKHPAAAYPIQRSPSAECRYWAKTRVLA